MSGKSDLITTQWKTSRRDFLLNAVRTGMALSGLGAVLQSCSGETARRNLNFVNWASAETATRDHINRALQAFENRNPVKVNNIGLSFDQLLAQLISMTDANIPLDVMELSGNQPYVLAAKGALIDLAPFVQQSWHEDSFPNSFEAGTYKGTLYAVPFSITPHGLWYSKLLMSRAGLDPTKPPKTIDELNQAIILLRDKLPPDAYPIGIDTSQTEYALVGFWPWIWTFGGNPMVDDGKGNVTINWEDEGTIAAFQWLQNAVTKKWTPPNLAIRDERQLMANQKMAFKLDGPYLTGIFGDLNPALSTAQKVNDQFGLTTVPLGPGVTRPVTCADIHNLSVAKSSADKELAWKLVDFLTTSPEVITAFLIPEGGVLPWRSYNIREQLYGKYYADAISRSFIYNVIPTMRPPAYGPRYTDATKAVVVALSEISNGSDVRPRLRKLNKDVKDIYHT